MRIRDRIIKTIIILIIFQCSIIKSEEGDNQGDVVPVIPQVVEPTTTDVGKEEPSSSVPSDTLPSDTLPSDTLPSDTLPSDALPSDTLPSNALPSNALPSDALPSDVAPSIPTDPNANNSTNTPTADTLPSLDPQSFQPESFLHNALLYSTQLPTNCTLDFVFLLSNPGINRPETLVQGKYKFEQSEEELEEEESGMKIKDVFNVRWEFSSEYIEEIGLNETNKLSENIINMYSKQNKFLNLSNTNETVFVTMDRSAFVTYTKRLLTSLYPILKNNFIAESPFTFENYNKSDYNPTVEPKSGNKKMPKVARIQDDYATTKLGFSFYRYCSKMINWKNFASKDKNLVYYFQYNFEDVIKKWTENFDKPEFGQIFYSIKNKPIYNLSENYFSNDLKQIHLIVTNLLADLARYKQNEIIIDTLSSFIPDSEEGIDRIKDLKKFLDNDLILYSDLYTYLQISPFLNFMIQQFNMKIRNERNTNSYYNKLVYIAVNEIALTSLYKILIYDHKKKNDVRYDEIPFIDYGYSVQFELWKNKTTTGFDYYIVMRENFNPKPKFVLTTRNFAILLQIFLIVPDFTIMEREFYCGKRA